VHRLVRHYGITNSHTRRNQGQSLLLRRGEPKQQLGLLLRRRRTSEAKGELPLRQLLLWARQARKIYFVERRGEARREKFMTMKTLEVIEQPADRRWLDRLVRLGVWFRNLRNRKTARAYRDLTRAMQKDADYAHTWQCNIACPLMDEGMSHEDANKAADRLMKHLFNVKTNQQSTGTR
jgi:hypothetical protein